jgi:hypothetical protein
MQRYPIFSILLFAIGDLGRISTEGKVFVFAFAFLVCGFFGVWLWPFPILDWSFCMFNSSLASRRPFVFLQMLIRVLVVYLSI